MFAFVTIVAATGSLLDPEFIDRMDREGPKLLPFIPERAMYWFSPSLNACVLGWEAFTSQAAQGTHWHARADGGLTAYSGHCWPASAGWADRERPWAQQLDTWLGDQDPAVARDRLTGHFDLIHFEASGQGTIVPDTLNCGPLYTAETQHLQVVSNRAGLAALAITPSGATPRRSPIGAGWLVFDAALFDDETGYAGVAHLPFGDAVRIDPVHGLRIERAERSPFAPGNPGDFPSTYEQLVPPLLEDLCAQLRFVSGLPAGNVELRLSGGKDSRILAAGIVATGLRDRIGLMTFGPPDKSDPIAAAEIARAFDLRWRLDDRRGRPAHVDLGKVALHTFLTEGMVSGWNATSNLDPHHDLTLTGVGGDFLGWRYESALGLAATNRTEALQQMLGRADFDRLHLLQDEARAWYFDEIVAWIDRRLDMGVDPSWIRALFLREGKLRCQTGPGRAAEASLWFDPLCSPLWMRASFRLPPHQRPGFRFHIDLIEALCPGMLDIPLADTVWTPESYAHRPDRQRFAQMEAILSSDAAAQNWRVLGWPEYRPLLADILLEQTNPVYQLLDYPRMERLMRKPSITATQGRVIYGALTAALWLGGHETRSPIGTPAA